MITKKIGSEGTNPGEYRIDKLAVELAKAGVEIPVVVMDDGVTLTFADDYEQIVNTVVAEHDPTTPLPVPPTETQLLQLALAEAIEKQEADNLASQLALAEFIESQVEGGV